MSQLYIFAFWPFMFEEEIPRTCDNKNSFYCINESHGWEYSGMAIPLQICREIFECQVKFLHVTFPAL